MNETEDRKSVVKINQINSWFFEKINKIARLTKEKRERTQMNKIRNEKRKLRSKLPEERK